MRNPRVYYGWPPLTPGIYGKLLFEEDFEEVVVTERDRLNAVKMVEFSSFNRLIYEYERRIIEKIELERINRNLTVDIENLTAELRVAKKET